MATKRTRSKPFSIRMTEEEFELINEKIKKSGQSKTDYLIQSMMETDVVVIEEIKPILAELKKQGTNLNQALRYTHESNGLEIKPINKAIKGCHLCYQNLYKLWKEVEKKKKVKKKKGAK